MTSIHTLVARYAEPFMLHFLVSSIVLAIAIAASYLPRLSARTRFAVVAIGIVKFFVPASILAPFIDRAAPPLMQMTMPRMLPAATAALATASEPVTTLFDWLVAGVFSISAIGIAATVIRGARTAVAATRSALPAAPREIALLNTARRRIGVDYAIDVVRSPISEAPAVLRILRPLIVLPADGPDVLDDDELESLLCHECAHVARHDNLFALFEGIARALFWFNPLVWLAHRRLAQEREKACDEIVADRGHGAETYAHALAKVCEAILARPAAGVSCMASAHLKQRMEHIMRYNSSRWTSLSHFASVSAAIVILFAGVAITATINAAPASITDPYAFTAKVTSAGGNIYIVQIQATEAADTHQVAWSPRWLRVRAGQPFTLRGGAVAGNEPNLDFRADGRLDDKGHLTAEMNVFRGADVLQRITIEAAPTDDRYLGAPMTMDLKGADIREVLQTFADFTGLIIVPAADVHGKVDAKFVNVPWDKALDQILLENGYTWRLTGDKMEVFRRSQ